MGMSERQLSLFGSVLAIALAVLTACALLPGNADDPPSRAVIDTYFIAHGMAEGYGESNAADPEVTAELNRLDATAAEQVRQLAAGGDVASTARAVAALTALADSQAGGVR